MNNYLNYIFATAIIVAVIFFLPDYYIPVPQEHLREVLGQTIICFLAVGIVFNEIVKETSK